MEDFNSKYSGEQVEELLDQVASGGTGVGESDIYIWDFNGAWEDGASGTIEREVLNKLAEAKSVWMRSGDVYTVCNQHVGDSSSLLLLFTIIQQDIMQNYAIIIDGETLQYNVAGYEISIQEAIDDLDDIRSGAEKGATALQEVPSEYVTALNNKVDKVDGKQLSTEDFTTILKQKLDGLSNYDDTTISQAVEKLRADLDALVSGDTTTAIKTFNEVIAFLDGIQDSQDLSSIIASIEQQIAGKMDSVTLAKVATSGSYDDLTNKPTIPAEQVNADWNATSGKAQILNKPTIPSAVTESTVSGWGFTKNTGTYSKPSTGIPKTDLASAVQTSLGKADSALQKLPSEAVIHNEDGDVITQRGTLVDNNVGMLYALPFTDDAGRENADAILAWYTLEGELVLQRGILVDNNEGHRYALPYASDEDKAGADSVIASEAYVDNEIVKFDNVAVEPLWEELDKKQPTLVSGENIKTINGKSILGSGNIEISGGGGSSGGGSKEFVEVTPMREPLGYYGNLGEAAPNKVYVFTKPIIGLSVAGFAQSDSKGDEYSIMFTASKDDISISLPSGSYNIYWANGVIPIINSGDLCELSLLRIGSDIKAVLTTFKAV